MVICKEYNNSYHNLTEKNNYTVKNPAIFIDEASMGEPHNEFGKWFVNKYYNGYSMIETLVLSKNESQEKVDELQNKIFDNPLTTVDYENICNAVDKMKCHKDMNKNTFKKYIKSCIGKSISTENW